MTREEFRMDLRKDVYPLSRTPIHFGSYLFKGNAPVPFGDYPLYNSRHLPVVIEEKRDV